MSQPTAERKSNFQMMTEFLEDVWTRQNEDTIFREFEGVATGLWPDEVGIDPTGFLQYYRALSPLIKDLTFEFTRWHEFEDKLWLSWIVHGKHWKRSERLLRWPGACLARFREGKLVQCDNYQDFMTLFSQLDLMPEQAFEYGLAGAEIVEAEQRRKELAPPSARGQSHFLWPGLRKVESGERELFLPCSAKRLEILAPGDELELPNEEQLEVLLESATFAMVVVNHLDVIEEADSSFAELVDRLPESLPGLTFHQILFPDDQESERQLFSELLEGKRLHYRHRVQLMRGRTVVWVHLAVARIAAAQGGSRIVRAVQEASRVEDLVEFQEAERKVLSLELHDGMAQELATLWLYLQTGRHQLEPTQALINRCLGVVEKMSNELRQRMKDLRSPILEGKPLSQALEELGAQFSRRHKLKVSVLARPEVDQTDHTVSLLVYRVVQEALRNVVNHAEANFCQVVVSKYGDRLHGTVTDDGRGFDPLEVAGKGRLGIVGMRDRCELVGGRLEVQSKPGSGTAVSFEVTGRGTA